MEELSGILAGVSVDTNGQMVSTWAMFPIRGKGVCSLLLFCVRLGTGNNKYETDIVHVGYRLASFLYVAMGLGTCNFFCVDISGIIWTKLILVLTVYAII
jgi:hypothetical protein